MGKNNFLKHTAIKIECYFYTQIKHLSMAGAFLMLKGGQQNGTNRIYKQWSNLSLF